MQRFGPVGNVSIWDNVLDVVPSWGYCSGVTLAEYIESKDLNLRDFADRLGVSKSALSRYARGERTMSVSLASRIIKATKGAVTLKDLVGSIVTGAVARP